jgi:hypothetical protein
MVGQPPDGPFEVVGDLGGQLRGAGGEWRGSAVGLAHEVDLAVGYGRPSTEFEPEAIALDHMRGVLRDGPAIPVPGGGRIPMTTGPARSATSSTLRSCATGIRCSRHAELLPSTLFRVGCSTSSSGSDAIPPESLKAARARGMSSFVGADPDAVLGLCQAECARVEADSASTVRVPQVGVVEDISAPDAVNLSAPFALARAVLPHMRRLGRGLIVNVSSVAGRRGWANASAYCAT